MLYTVHIPTLEPSLRQKTELKEQ